ncbi:CRE-PLD-1 protein [Aphelenchoides avenae]|nr:CRE-PLD-1 protein [Aphelenchus avenae]
MMTATEQPGSSSNNGTTQETPGANKDSLSYHAVYDVPKEAAYWIPDTPIEAEIVGVLYMIDKSRNVTYVIQMRHGRFEWTLTKRAKDFAKLRRALLAHRVKGRFKHPWRRTKEAIEDAVRKAARAVGVEDSDGEPEERTGEKSAAVEAERRLQEWINMVLSSPKRRSYRETAEFFEVSRLSFVGQLGGKLKEGSVTKQPGGWKVYIRLKQLIQWLLPHRDRWLVLKDSYLCVLHPTSGHLKQVMLFDESFSIEVTDEKNFKVSNFQYEWSIRCHHAEDVTPWKLAIEDALHAQAGQVWKHGHPNGSSYPTRGNSYCQWLVDGKDYFEKLCVMLEIAREEIFIGAWWLCPVIYMRRPLTDGNHWRLDEILKRKAQEGVRIFVLLQKEMELLIDQKSLYFKQLLHGLHENIRVLRHPDHYPDTGIFFWTHHEKMVVIDQLIAFVGGIDISYGRWDDATHPMTDLGSIVDVPKEAINPRTPAHRLLRNRRVIRKRLPRRERKAQIQVVSLSEEDIKSLVPVN